MTKVHDGTGSGRTALVNTNNRLATNAVTVAEDHIIALTSAKVWSCTFKDVDPTAADDYFFYLKNTSTNFYYNVSDIRIASTVAGQLEVNSVSGTAAGGTAVSPVSRRVNDVAIPGATIESGLNITGLTSNGTLFLLTLAAGTTFQLRTSSRIIVPPGQAFGLLWGESTGVLSGTVSIYEKSVDEIL